MSTYRLRYGMTRTIHAGRADDYIPAMDGYRPGAAQDEAVIDVDLPTGTPPHDIAEALYMATNAPAEVLKGSPLALAIFDALVTAQAQGGRLRSMSVGDTLLILAPTEQVTALECASFGFDDLPEVSAFQTA